MNMNGEITISDLKGYIRKHRNDGSYNFLGFVENKDLTDDVENYFSFYNNSGSSVICYNWVDGNDMLKSLIKRIERSESKKEVI